VDLRGQGAGHLIGPDLQQQADGLIGEIFGAEKAGQRGQHDQERKQRHQGGEGDMAGDRPAVIGKKRIEGVHHNIVDGAYLPHVPPGPGSARQITGPHVSF
jgi:hypothetical protein